MSESFVKKSSDAQKMSSEPNIDIIFKETVRQVVEAYPDGVYLDQLRDKYRVLVSNEVTLFVIFSAVALTNFLVTGSQVTNR